MGEGAREPQESMIWHGRRSERVTTRRALLKAAGAAAVVAASGVGVRAFTTGLVGGDDRAFELWRQWQSGALDQTSLLLAAAVLAASPHNSQPWQLVVGASTIEVHLDPTRALGPVDPFLRQMWLGAGCAIENMVVAAQGRGLALTLDSSAGTSPTLAARARLGGAAPVERRHFDAIGRRHTNRGAFHRARSLAPEVLDALHAQASDPDTRLVLHRWDSSAGRAFADEIVAATRCLIADAAFIDASDRWFRLTPREVASHRDGPSLRAAGLGRATEWLAVLGPRPGAQRSHDEWLRSTVERHLGTAPMFGLVCTRDPAAAAQRVAAGRLWQRLQLEATVLGLGAQPLDQMLELVDRRRQLGIGDDTPARLQTLVGADGWVPVMMFRIGYPTRPAPPSARRPLHEFLRPA
jgi:nitroreductase